MTERRNPLKLLKTAVSFPVMLGGLLLVGVLQVASAFRVDSDAWWHLVVGQRILATHTWPTFDQYSFTAGGTPWIAYEWMAEVLIALANRAGGLVGLMGLLFALTCVLMLLIYYYAYLSCRNSKAAFVATVAVLPLAGVWFSLHPQLLGYIFLLLTLICLERFRSGDRKILWMLPVIFCLWVNAHGTFVFGGVAYGIYWLSGLVDFQSGSLVAKRWTAAERLQLEIVALLSLLASCITPYGSRLAAYPANMLLLQPVNMANITTWQPIPLGIWHGQYFLALVLLFIFALAALPLQIRLEELALFFFAVVMTALHARSLPLFAIVFAPILAGLLARWVPNYEPSQDRYILNAIIIAAAILVMYKVFPSRQTLERTVAAAYPQKGVEYLREHPQLGPVLNKLEWGGYLISELGPARRVFIDGRLDIYEYTGVLSDYLHIADVAPDTFLLLRKYNLQSCFTSPREPLATLLAASPDWKREYEDSQSVLFVRKESAASRP